ncbi:hypothetical protein FPOA_05945 [Fusarium poae]|uniref:Uncharacterized protein n=1 Tax=Fusarium poae TaxID=36050 RepID=A0A1B8AY29_FUSPO|nr:hypothetical protein FPOA_05945 [Fusarium poae]
MCDVVNCIEARQKLKTKEQSCWVIDPTCVNYVWVYSSRLGKIHEGRQWIDHIGTRGHVTQAMMDSLQLFHSTKLDILWNLLSLQVAQTLEVHITKWISQRDHWGKMYQLWRKPESRLAVEGRLAMSLCERHKGVLPTQHPASHICVAGGIS